VSINIIVWHSNNYQGSGADVSATGTNR